MEKKTKKRLFIVALVIAIIAVIAAFYWKVKGSGLGSLKNSNAVKTEINKEKYILPAKIENYVNKIEISYKPKKFGLSEIKEGKDVFDLFMKLWDKKIIEVQEEVYCLFLNTRSQVIGIINISKGGISSTVVDYKIVLSTALNCLARGVVIVHNHPSGSFNFSEKDILMAQTLKKQLKVIDIDLIDSLIITRSGISSMNKKNILI